MTPTKHYGVIACIVGNEGEGFGDLSITAILATSDHYPRSRIVVGSTQASEVNLGQFVLTVAQADKLIAYLQQAREDVVAACPDAAKSEGT